MQNDAVAKIKQAVTMRDICDRYGIQVNAAGFACCPLHGEKTASMKIYGGDRGWHCFGCNQGGDVIKFVQLFFGTDFLTAINRINEDFSLGLQIGPAKDPEAERAARRNAYLLRKQRAARQKHLERLREARDAALAEFAKLDTLAEDARTAASRYGLDALTPEQTDALLGVDAAWARLNEADLALRDYEKQIHTGTTPAEVIH